MIQTSARELSAFHFAASTQAAAPRQRLLLDLAAREEGRGLGRLALGAGKQRGGRGGGSGGSGGGGSGPSPARRSGPCARCLGLAPGVGARPCGGLLCLTRGLGSLGSVLRRDQLGQVGQPLRLARGERRGQGGAALGRAGVDVGERSVNRGRIVVCLLGAEEPLARVGERASDALAVAVAQAQFGHGKGVAFLGAEAVVVRRALKVNGHAAAKVVGSANVVLRSSVALLSGLAEAA